MKNINSQLVLVKAVFFFLIIAGCHINNTGETLTKDGSSVSPLFELVKPSKSGVKFANTITETDALNPIFYDGIYNGAGVGVGDFNNDGLQDIFFVGNMVPSKLYLNEGGFKFKDITKKAGLDIGEGWPAGVAVADVNADGFLDIYVCRHLLDDGKLRKNLFFVNNGDLTFTESADKYNIADPGFSIQANFFDYDKDGWLDLYVANQPANNVSMRTELMKTKDKRYTDRLYRNNGNGKFTDVTVPAGITNFSFSLSATVSDLDRDSWPDIYVACDFDRPDFFYHNNGDGTFTEILQTSMKHISNFSMGADIADFNNDGWTDIYTSDMVAEDNFRNKTNMSGMNPDAFWANIRRGYFYQYMFNALQLNNGNGTYSEIAQMAGVSHTDWSWAPLFADFDNDGWKDLYVTNGLLRDIRNKDYQHDGKEFLQEKLSSGMSQEDVRRSVPPMEFVKLAPSQKIVNYIYRNNGDLTFDKMMDAWGTNQPSFTNGAAYADFDNDGDLDLVTNNINDPAFLYKNLSNERKKSNWLSLKLLGDHPNLNSYGARVEIWNGNEIQVQEVSPVRGYMSTNENLLHFGLGEKGAIERLTVRWLDGREVVMENVPANQRLTLQQKDGKPTNYTMPQTDGLLKDITADAGIDFQHKEADFDDYKEEILLPYRSSHLGPCLATFDVDGNGMEDFFIGGAAGQSGELYLQMGGDKFKKAPSKPWGEDANQEDTGALFFDADGDGDADLYVSSGSNEFPERSPLYQDRLYLNSGGGHFTKASKSLPNLPISSNNATAADFDKDGDLDLFVGGRQTPQRYGHPVSSTILRNNKGIFVDATAEIAPGLQNIGMVTDALWMDHDNDDDLDLIVVGEWMPITLLTNENGKLVNAQFPISNFQSPTSGWWNTLSAADMDNDGDLDLFAGNLGLNIKYKASEEYPFKCYIKDFDNNGTNDIYLGYYDNEGVCYPVRGRQCSSEQMPFIAEKFDTYRAFASNDIEQILEGRLDNAIELKAHTFASVYLENQGNGQFNLVKLPLQAQISPIYGFAIHDWNNDGHLDAYLAGNFHHREVETTRSDAGIGCVMLGDGKGNFTPLSQPEIGPIADRDVRSVKKVLNKNGLPLILIANGGDGVQVFKAMGNKNL